MSQPLRDFSNRDAIRLLKEGGLLLDIRTKEEYCKGHLRDAILLPTPVPHPPLNTREQDTLRDQLWYLVMSHGLSLDYPIVIYCRKGIRAGMAKQFLQEMGFRRVVAWGGVEEPPLKDFFKNRALICTHNPDLQ